MKISHESGIKINDELRKIIEKALEKAGGKVNRLARLSGCKQSSVDRWVGRNKDKTDFISWDAWPALRKHLQSYGLLNPNEPRWMTPSELLEFTKTLSSLTKDETEILDLFRKLNDEGKLLAVKSLESLASSSATTKN